MTGRHGSRINTDPFPNESKRRKLLAKSGGMLPQETFWLLTPPFRQDNYRLSKPFSRFQFGTFLLIKNILVIRNQTNFRKTETGVDPCLTGN